MIPRIIHRIWLGRRPEPKAHERYLASFLEHCPGWEVITWHNLPPLENQALFDRATALAQKADIARLELLVEYGGIYVDCDVECIRPLDGVRNIGKDFAGFAGWEGSDVIGTAVLGAAPGSPFFALAIDALPAWCGRHEGELINVQTGPVFLTHLYHRHPDLLFTFPKDFFYPYKWDERKPERYSHTAALVHHWDGSGR